MSKNYVERLPHSCGTSRGLQVFLDPDGSYRGYCFACNTRVEDPYNDKPEGYEPPAAKEIDPEEQEKQFKYLATLPSADLPELKLSKATLDYFGVKLGYDQETASEVRSHYYPLENEEGDVCAYKVRVVENKEFFSLGTYKAATPFGWNQALRAGGFKLFITEGEKDALALFQVLKSRGKTDRPPAVISLKGGVTSVGDMAKYFKHLSKWKEVVLCFDNDEPGLEAISEFTKMYPEAKVATLPLKDAHDMLMAGREQELFNACVFQAKHKLSDKLIRSDSLWERARQRPEEGLAWPWPQLSGVTRGIRRGEGYYFGAGVKMG